MAARNGGTPSPAGNARDRAKPVEPLKRSGKGVAAFSLARYKDHAATLQALVTIFAMLVAGGWTYVLFIENRERNAKVSVEHRIQPVPLTGDLVLLRTTVKVTNIGKVLLSVGDTTVWVQQITPLVDCDDEARCPMTLAGAGKGVRATDAPTASWPLLDAWSGKVDSELEPGEAETLAFDFVVPVAVQTIQVYSYLENSTKGGIGWKDHSIHTLGPLGSKATEEHGSADTRPQGGEMNGAQP